VSNQSITYLVVACAAVFGIAAFVWLIVVPTVGAYAKTWERVAAGFLTLYVLAALLGIGLVAGLAVIYFWPRVF